MSSHDAYDEFDLLGQPASDPAASNHEFSNAALITYEAYSRDPSLFPHCGLLGSVLRQTTNDGVSRIPDDPRLYFNTATPWSAVVCGVQGSGKSHTVSCLLEASLISDRRIGTQTEPLAGLTFHYDEENGGRPCEAAYLSASAGSASLSTTYVRKVTVLASPNNVHAMASVYGTLPNVKVHPLYFKEAHLNAARILAMMGCDNLDSLPLYMKKALSIVRDLGVGNFTYRGFRAKLKEAEIRFNDAQRAGVEMRTGLLDSYLDEQVPDVTTFFGKGDLVIVDLSDPFLASVDAAILFDIVLGLFVDWETSAGKVVVLDEAHKYLTNSSASRLPRSLSSLIRQQRHLGVRLVIATQEPTAVPVTLVELCSFVICHKFSSPNWVTYLKGHISIGEGVLEGAWEKEVMQLRTGHALVFCSSALCLKNPEDDPTGWGEMEMTALGMGCLFIRTRLRVTMDGGKSIVAGKALPTARQVLGKRLVSTLARTPLDELSGLPIPLNIPVSQPHRPSPAPSNPVQAASPHYTTQPLGGDASQTIPTPASPARSQPSDVESRFTSAAPPDRGGAFPPLTTQPKKQQPSSLTLQEKPAPETWSSIAKRDVIPDPSSPTFVKYSEPTPLINPTTRAPGKFAPLIRALSTHPHERPMRSVIHDMLLSERPDYLAKAGYTRWAEYAQAAHAAGLVELGIVDSSAWIALKKRSSANQTRVAPSSNTLRTHLTPTPSIPPSTGPSKIQQGEAKPSTLFQPLISVMEYYNDHMGVDQPSLESVTWKLEREAPDVCSSVDCEDMKQYLGKAADAGVVRIRTDGMWGSNWVQLEPGMKDGPANVVSPPSPSLPQPSRRMTKRFRFLLDALDAHGDTYVLQNALAAELKVMDPTYLTKAGFEKWSLYVDAAAAAGLVAIGGPKNGMAWIHRVSGNSQASVESNAPTVADPRFALLVKVLEEHPDDIPMRSRIAEHIIGLRPGFFSAGYSGFYSWKEYAAAAEESGVIVLGGGDHSYPWVALPSRLNAARTDTPGSEPGKQTGKDSWSTIISTAQKKDIASLVGIIRGQRSTQPLQSVVAQHMRDQHPIFFNHFDSWEALLAAALKAGRVQVGGAGGKEWVSCI